MPFEVYVLGSHPGAKNPRPLNLERIARTLRGLPGVDPVADREHTWLIRAVTYKPVDPEVLEAHRLKYLPKDQQPAPKKRGRKKKEKTTQAPDEAAKAAIAAANAPPPPREVKSIGAVVASLVPLTDAEFGGVLAARLVDGLSERDTLAARARAREVLFALRRKLKLKLFDPVEGGEVEPDIPYIHDPLENAPSPDLDPDLASDDNESEEDLW